MISGSTTRLLMVLLTVSVCVDARAVWEKYSPFDRVNAPPPFRNTVLTLVRHGYDEAGPRFFEFFRPEEKAPCLRIDWADEGNRLSVPLGGRNAHFSAPLDGSPVCDAEASTTDLNGDLLPDYIVVTHSGGNGLAAQITTITFLLSSPTGYIAREVLSFDAAPTDLVDLDRDGRPEFVHCMCVWGDKGSDGRSHNFWVYNLLGFSGTNIVSLNSTSAEFPNWVIYTYNENHKDSAQLTAVQRQRQWLLAWREQTGVSATNFFPNLDAVAAEQGRTLARR